MPKDEASRDVLDFQNRLQCLGILVKATGMDALVVGVSGINAVDNPGPGIAWRAA